MQVLITDPEKLEGIRQRESDITKEKIEKILAAGANVILCTGGIDDLCLKVINFYCRPFDMPSIVNYIKMKYPMLCKHANVFKLTGLVMP